MEFAKYLLERYGPDVDDDSCWHLILSFDFSAPLKRESFFNHQNDRYYSDKTRKELGEVLQVKVGKYSRGLMIAGCISSRGLVPPHAPGTSSIEKQQLQL